MSENPDIRIARHTAQLIWHDALAHPPHGFFGLLGETDGNRIDQAVTSVTCDAPDAFIRSTGSAWVQQGIHLRGALYSSYDTRLFADIEAAAGERPARPFVHIVISLDTEGRLDSMAYLLKDGQSLSAPLVMVEDGQTASSR